MVFNLLNLTILAGPLAEMLSTILSFVPQLLKAALILLVAWIVAVVLKNIIQRIGKSQRVSQALKKSSFITNDQQLFSIVDQVANVLFYLVLLVFLPGILSALSIEGLSGPFSNMLQDFLAFIPNLLAAFLVVVIGWFIAKLVRDLVTNFLQALGIDQWARKLGLNKLTESNPLSKIVGYIVYILILIPVIITALEQLQLDGITEPAISMLEDVFTMIPNIVMAVILIIAGIYIGRFVARFVSSLLKNVGVDSFIHQLNIRTNRFSLSSLIGTLTQILIVFLFTVEALQLVELEFLVTIATGVLAYVPNVIAAVLIVGAAIIIGGFVERIVSSILTGDLQILGVISKYAIIALSVFMGLDQLQVAQSIVQLAFMLILGGVALAFGLAFGLGGRDFAEKYLIKLDKRIEKTSVTKQTPSTFTQEDDDNHQDGFTPPPTI
ncbi:mechanosensitive ion channel [Bacillus coahuilensis]|uniref:mechanosensitive ion channel n=1 Tax=Bacillus coahuilensis TaxID=408580 RepID=UPI000750328A|nr:mechanosensitive ion channel [Bacillus coahuilensis]